ncbi:DUF4177 domain-containing protein [Paenibacillus durus]|uniref:DUF4177 domain-containing protein n=1 Tax=Paenibacillus durus ATCC 35681 TaxID=1333534 RepID=A0A0F7FAC9_PAEDU|nr:DUF4177 domain-containing protein [Paenibacillus durus]AKG35583.1 hypothetical protein VK70_14195 [Paenibacillus durus ATCC 35681]
MNRWEYRTVKYKTGGFLGGKLDEEDFENLLNSYGNDGWELVSCFDTSISQGQTRDVVAIFKRPV